MIYIACFACVNLLSYMLMWKDKRAARKGAWRVSEKYFFILALAGGSPGIYAAMKAPIYHKTTKPAFQFGIPLLMVCQIIFFLFILVF